MNSKNYFCIALQSALAATFCLALLTPLYLSHPGFRETMSGTPAIMMSGSNQSSMRQGYRVVLKDPISGEMRFHCLVALQVSHTDSSRLI